MDSQMYISLEGIYRQCINGQTFLSSFFSHLFPFICLMIIIACVFRVLNINSAFGFCSVHVPMNVGKKHISIKFLSLFYDRCGSERQSRVINRRKKVIFLFD